MTEPILLSAERIAEIADLYSSEQDRAAGHVRELLGHIAALAATPSEPARRPGYVLDYDPEERWLVISDPEGGSNIIARDVRPEDAVYLVAGYKAWATPPPPLDVKALTQAIANAGSRRGDWVDRIAAEYVRLATGEPEPFDSPDFGEGPGSGDEAEGLGTEEAER